MKKILISVGTRPNFIKITQFRAAAAAHDVEISIVHTGQHYDRFMSSVFFEQFGLQPDHFLVLSSRTPAEQVGEMTQKLAALMQQIQPDLLIVPGDVNSTLAAAIAANKLGIPVAHLESGLRSFDRSMPEEINRILVDEITQEYLVTEQSGLDHLRAEGKDEKRIHFVGNTMIDTLVAFDEQIEQSAVLEEHQLVKKNFALLTMHRPSNVDSREGLQFIIDLIRAVSAHQKVVFPIHPRSKKKFENFGMWEELQSIPKLVLTEPLDYFAFQKLVKHAQVILTDSGGIQEESTFRQVPCLTIRENTERPITIDLGTNQLVPAKVEVIMEKMKSPKSGQIPPLWDGKATWRVMEHLLNSLHE